MDSSRPFANLLKDMLASFIETYNKKNPDNLVVPDATSLGDMKKVSDWLFTSYPSHPPFIERIAALEIQGALTDALQHNAARKGRVVTGQDKKDQTSWILEQIMRQQKEGTLPDPVSMKPIPSIPEHVREQVQGIKKIPMSDVDVPVRQGPPMPTKEKPEVIRK
jgi:hypothetical protein